MVAQRTVDAQGRRLCEIYLINLAIFIPLRTGARYVELCSLVAILVIRVLIEYLIAIITQIHIDEAICTVGLVLDIVHVPLVLILLL